MSLQGSELRDETLRAQEVRKANQEYSPRRKCLDEIVQCRYRMIQMLE